MNSRSPDCAAGCSLSSVSTICRTMCARVRLHSCRPVSSTCRATILSPAVSRSGPVCLNCSAHVTSPCIAARRCLQMHPSALATTCAHAIWAASCISSRTLLFPSSPGVAAIMLLHGFLGVAGKARLKQAAWLRSYSPIPRPPHPTLSRRHSLCACGHAQKMRSRVTTAPALHDSCGHDRPASRGFHDETLLALSRTRSCHSCSVTPSTHATYFHRHRPRPWLIDTAVSESLPAAVRASLARCPVSRRRAPRRSL